jgi:hypothetical protein
MSTPSTRRILYCHCAYAQVVPVETKTLVLEQLSASGASFEAVPDLCEMSARRDPGLAEMSKDAEATIVACYPRAVRWLFEAAGAQLPEGVRVLNMRTAEAPEILAQLEVPTSMETT